MKTLYILLLFPLIANAEIYRCGNTYSESPCPNAKRVAAAAQPSPDEQVAAQVRAAADIARTADDPKRLMCESMDRRRKEARELAKTQEWVRAYWQRYENDYAVNCR